MAAGVALSLLLLGGALQLTGAANPGAAGIAIGAAGTTAALAALPLSYTLRAVAIAAMGALLMALGVDGAGPLAASDDGASEFTRFLSLATLPGALLFRARYRAYPRARLVLGVALIASLPFAASQVLVAADAAAPLASRASAALDLGILLSGLLGFMGEDTTAGGSVWAALVLGCLPANIAVRALDAPGPSADLALIAALGTAGAGALLAQGVFQLLAAWLGSDARRLVRKKSGAASPA